jgi:hypothetical protein
VLWITQRWSVEIEDGSALLPGARTGQMIDLPTGFVPISFADPITYRQATRRARLTSAVFD